MELVYLIFEPKCEAFFSFEMNEKEMRGQHFTFCSVSPADTFRFDCLFGFDVFFAYLSCVFLTEVFIMQFQDVINLIRRFVPVKFDQCRTTR